MVAAKDALWPFQQAVFALLNGETDLTDLAPVFDEPPINQPFPYVLIGEFDANEWRSHDRPGAEIASSIHIWTDHKGNKDALLIKDQIDLLLGDITADGITVTGFDVSGIWRAGSSTLREFIEGGRMARHTICRYRAKLLQTV